MVKIADLVPRVQANLGLVGGTSAQFYAGTVIQEKITTAFNLLFERCFWDSYTHWKQATLDGVLGVVTESCDVWEYPLRKFIDIDSVMPVDCPNKGLKATPRNIAPLLVTGTSPKFIENYEAVPAKVFRVVPYVSTGDILVRYRTRPATLNLDTEVLLDEELLKLAATWMYMVDDGSNPDSTNAALGMMQQRERSVLGMQHNQPIPLNENRPFDDVFRWHG